VLLSRCLSRLCDVYIGLLSTDTAAPTAINSIIDLISAPLCTIAIYILQAVCVLVSYTILPQSIHGYILENMSDALVPPKPKLLLMATSTATSADASMTCLKAELTGSGLVRLSVSGTLPSRIASIANAASNAPVHQHIHVCRCMHV
jgi:hypothetical protein